MKGELVTLPAITSICATLGAKTPNPKTLEFTENRECIPNTVSDMQAVRACYNFLNDHRILVEPACGASLALLYEKPEIFDKFKSICVEVCGGNGISLPMLEKYIKDFQITLTQ